MDVRLLGDVEVEHDGSSVALGGPKERALLTVLSLHPGRVVSREALVDALWGDNPPGRTRHTLDVHVARLRAALDAGGLRGLIETRPGGYAAVLDCEEIDLCRFERLVGAGLRELAAGEAEQAGETLRAALAIPRGDPLAEFASEAFAVPEIRRIDELEIAATEGRIDAELALGRHAELTGDLQALVERHPFRERLRAQLMLALYRSGQQAAALQCYADARRLLVDELGIEPSDELKRLQQAILRHDAELEGVPRSSEAERPPTHYALSGDVSIAYQMTGAGPFDVLWTPDWIWNVDLDWGLRPRAALLRRVSSFCRLIRFDSRGTGMSDRAPAGDVESRLADCLVVLDSAGCSSVALVGSQLSVRFAAAHPERVWALVLWGTTARLRRASGYPNGYSDADLDENVAEIMRLWEPGGAERAAADLQAEDVHGLATLWRQSATPGAALELQRAATSSDVRDLLPAIAVPTLVIGREGPEPANAALATPSGSAYLAQRIPGARYVTFPQCDRVLFGASSDFEPIVSEIERFLRDAWHSARSNRSGGS